MSILLSLSPKKSPVEESLIACFPTGRVVVLKP
jgi:hypothetical protein